MEVVSSVALVIMVVMVVVETPAVASTLIVMAMSTLVVTNYEDSDGGESCRGSTVLSVVVKVSVSGNSGRVSGCWSVYWRWLNDSSILSVFSPPSLNKSAIHSLYMTLTTHQSSYIMINYAYEYINSTYMNIQTTRRDRGGRTQENDEG